MSLLLFIFLTFSCCLEPPQSEVPVNGTYIYEVAFAEWDGKTMGDVRSAGAQEDQRS
jgi:hypothetical protein